MLDWIRRSLAKTALSVDGEGRRAQLEEEKTPPPERFVLSITLMIVFFAGLVALEITHMVIFREFNDVIFNGVMLIVGGLVGALFGYREAP